MTDCLNKSELIEYIQSELDAIEDYVAIHGKDVEYYTNLERNQRVLESVLIKIKAGKFDV